MEGKGVLREPLGWGLHHAGLQAGWLPELKYFYPPTELPEVLLKLCTTPGWWRGDLALPPALVLLAWCRDPRAAASRRHSTGSDWAATRKAPALCCRAPWCQLWCKVSSPCSAWSTGSAGSFLCGSCTLWLSPGVGTDQRDQRIRR